MLVTDLSPADKAWVRERTELLFGGEFLVSRHMTHDPTLLPGFIAVENGERMGLATYHLEGNRCELVSIDALCQFIGVGTALLEAVEAAARAEGCRMLWLITTNDNLDALRFFQRRGFVISGFRLGGMNRIRQLKPAIPETGYYNIPLRDEIEMHKPIGSGDGWRVVQGNGAATLALPSASTPRR
ncbi:MAG: GNAT family N-acetyltransferase [Candidatus Krumholzibacteriia bacterium]